MQPIKKGDAGVTRVVVYSRFSPRRNAIDCESCEVQEAYCDEFVTRQGWQIVARFRDEAVSGKTEIEDRNLRTAIDSLRKGDVLLVMKRDRLARDLLIGLQIERAVENRKARVVCCQGETFGSDPNAVMMKQMLMVVAEWERKIIADRTRQAMKVHQRNGHRVSKVPPYGWKIDPADNMRMIKDEREQTVVGEILDRHKKGENNHEIARALDPALARAGRWNAETVRRILKREIE